MFRRQTEPPATRSQRASEPIEEDSSSSEEVDAEKTPLQQLLESPKKPKADLPLVMVKEMEEIPVLKLFGHHLQTFEGGSRKKRVGTDHVRTVARLLYEVDSNFTAVQKLCQNLAMNRIRNNFFAGNDLLGKDRRKPATLKAYIVSYRIFLKFILSRREDVRELTPITDTDIRQVESALARLESWPKSYTDAFNLRRTEVRQRDEEERLSADDFKAFVNSDKAKDIKQKYEEVLSKPNDIVDINTFAELRDYLLLRVITASGQRCGAAGNLTLEEFSNGIQHTDNLFVTHSLRHKTAAGGPAKLLWDNELKKMAVTYSTMLRPLYANERSVIPSSAGIPEKPAFFINAAGRPMNKSQISNVGKSSRVENSQGNYNDAEKAGR